jgi:hypothetical protein
MTEVAGKLSSICPVPNEAVLTSRRRPLISIQSQVRVLHGLQIFYTYVAGLSRFLGAEKGIPEKAVNALS